MATPSSFRGPSSTGRFSSFDGSAPKRMFGGGGSGTGVFKPQVSNGGYNSRYRTLPLTQILAQREGSPAAKYASGEAVPAGMRINVPGYNTSGVGPGTRGYAGSWRPGGYNYGEGTGRPSARTSDEFYAQRDMTSGNPLDNLELGNSNLMGQFLKNAIAEARGVQNGGGGQVASDPFAGRTTYGDGAGGVMETPVATPSGEPSPMEIQQMIADARRQETQDMLAARGNQDPSMSFFGAGGTTPGATIDGLPSDLYFQYKANESGQGNKFAQPPYGGPMTEEGSPEAWQYQKRLAPFLRNLGIGQPFTPRRPF